MTAKGHQGSPNTMRCSSSSWNRKARWQQQSKPTQIPTRLHDSCVCSELKPWILLAWIQQNIQKLQPQSVSNPRQWRVPEVEEVLYTRASGMAKSRRLQNHRAKDPAPAAGSVSSISRPGHFRRPQKINAAHLTTIPLGLCLLRITGSSPV